MQKVLSGVRIADFTHVLSGPIATHFLCLLGADVIKVESPGSGDTMRNYAADQSGMAPPFIAVNAGKRSITLDLKSEEGIANAKRLIASSDIVVENFRPGVMERLGLGYQACKALKTDIIYCSISGYGQFGNLKNYPAIDQIIQSTSGVMSLTGETGSSAMRIGFPVVDTFSGLLAAFAIMTSLLHRERTGEGQSIDLAMYDAALVMMISILGPYLVDGKAPQKQGNRGFSQSPTADTFPTKEGELTLGAVRQEQFERLCNAIGCPELIHDSRYKDRLTRVEHADSLRDAVIEGLATRTAEEWEPILNAVSVAAGVVRDIPAVADQPYLKDREVKFQVPKPGVPDEMVEILNVGFRFNKEKTGHNRPPPFLGEHTEQILKELLELSH